MEQTLPENRLFQNYDWNLCILTFVLLLVGILNLYSATFLDEINSFYRQLTWLSLGLGVAFLLSIIDYRIYEPLSYPLYVLCIVLLILVFFMGREIYGSTRWLHLGPVNVQTSELAKIAIIFVLARYFSNDSSSPEGYSLVQLIRPGILVLILAVLVFKQPDLGTALMLVFIAMTMIFYARVRLSSLMTAVVAFLCVAPAAYFYVLKEYQRQRILTLFNPDRDPLGDGYHSIQAMITIGSGQWLGRGYLQGSQSKLDFIPKHSTDFIYSVFAEEWGLVGTVVLLSLFFSLILMGLSIASKARDAFGGYLAIGCTSLLFWHFFVNIGMELGILPVVGITLPFMSYGGSSLLICLFCIGILMNVSSRRFMF